MGVFQHAQYYFAESNVLSSASAGFRWWGSWGQGVVGGPMCRYRIFR